MGALITSNTNKTLLVMKSYKEKLINTYKEKFNLSGAELEKYRNITELNAKNLWYDLQRNDNETRLYRDGAFVGYAQDEEHAIKHIMG